MVYLDNASTTKVYDEVNQLLYDYNNIDYFNPGGLYKAGTKISVKINNARRCFVSMLGGKISDNFVFTSGATEANNMVLNFAKKFKKKRFIFSMGEHPSIYNTAIELKNQGYDVQFVGLTKSGVVDMEDFKSKLNPDTSFVSIMHVSNETGAINPIKKLALLAKNVNKDIIFHSDGVQAFGKINVNVSNLGVDLYTISGHKIHAPKGVGGIYISSKINMKPFIFGGGQEMGFRSGTENVPGILAFEKAANISLENLDKNYSLITNLKTTFINKLNLLTYKPIIVSDEECSPYIISLLCKNLRGETILHKLDDCGFIIGNGSACSTKKKGNRILTAMGYSDDEIEGALRLSFSNDNSVEEIDEFVKTFEKVVNEYKEGTGR